MLVHDTTAPVFTFVSPNLVVNATGPAGAKVSYAKAIVTDAVGPVTITYSQASKTVFPLGTTTVTVTATDGAGNHSSSSFTIAVTDLPVFTSVSPNVLVNATSPAGAVVTYAAATATEPVGSVAITYSQASGTTFTPGNTVVTVTATNTALNQVMMTFTVRVQDIPVITSVSPDLVAEAASAAGAMVSYAAATATGVVAAPVLTYSQASGTTFALGTTTVMVTATGATGDHVSQSFLVIVQDTTPPVITLVSPNLTIEATSPAGATVGYIAATATDAVGPITISYSQASGTVFPLGTTTVTVSATDGAGNQTSTSFTVLVQDTTPPAFTFVSPNLVIPATSAAGAIMNYAPATATDAVGPVSIVYNLASGTALPIGTTTITVTAFDGAGNFTTQTFTVTVTDVPVITAISPSLTISHTSPLGAIVTYAPAAATDPTGPVAIFYSQASGTLFPVGTTIVHVTAFNAALNQSSMTFMVTVL